MRIRLYDHPFADAAPQVFTADNLALWLLEYYGDTPTVNVQIFEGEPSARSEITRDVDAILTACAEEYVILQSPGLAYLPYIIISVVFAVASYLLTPKPALPENVNRTQQSPNNALGARENKVRLLERVEDIYGTVKSVPSLMMPTYNKYIDHQKYEYGYYCVGRGYYDIAELRDGATLLADIGGSRAAIYAPFTSPNNGAAPQAQIGDAITDAMLTVARSTDVDGITLHAPNQIQLPASGTTYTFKPVFSGDKIVQSDKSPNFNSIIKVGDTITVAMASFYATIDSGSDYDGTMVNETAISGPYDYSGAYVVAAVSDGEITLSTATFAVQKTLTSVVQLSGATGYTGWMTLPQSDRTAVWINVLAQNGLYKEDGGKAVQAVDFTIEIEQLSAALVPTGTVDTVTGTLSGAVSDERAITIERITPWAGPVRVRMKRTSDHDFAYKGTVVDEVKWADLYSVSPVTKTEFGNKTTIHTVTQATARATSVKSRQLNCIASRRLPTYNGSSFSGAFNAAGLLVSGSISATSKLVDIIAAIAVDPKIGARDLATEIDMAQIWRVQQALDAWNTECGQFNYTFDTDNMSFEETIINVANAGFCIAYRQNGKIRLAFDRAQTSSAALFTHRNKKPNAETITRKFASDAEYDGIEFVYADPVTHQSETIKLPLDGSYTKLKKTEITGIRSFTQAWLRANREYQKLIGQRINIQTTTTLDARSLLPNSRIDVVDNTRFKSYDGEVIAQNGVELTLSQDVIFTPSQPHSIVLMRRDGTLQSISASAGSAPNKVLLQSLPSEAIVTSYGADGVRTIYSFAADGARGAMAYLVQEIDLSDSQYATIRAINYSTDYYQMDVAAIPAKASIIN